MLAALIVGIVFAGAFALRIAATVAFAKDPELTALYYKARTRAI